MAAENFKVKKGLEVGTAITATSSGVNVTGVVTATQFVGDGSGLTGVTGSGSGVVIKHDGSAIGTASTINFSTNLDVSAISAGIVTITASGGDVVEDTTPQLGGNLDLDGKFINGTGGANITGVVTATTGDFVNLDVDGETDLDDLSVAGVSTFTGAIDANGDLDVDGQTNLDDVSIVGVATVTNTSNSNILIETSDTTSSRLVVKNSQRAFAVETVTGGSFRIRDGSVNQERLTINSSGNVSIPNQLDVDGQTDLDDVVVAGVSTFNDGITLGTNSSTFAAKFIDNAVANFGTNNNLQISHDSSNALIRNSTGKIVVVGVVSATSGANITGVVTATTFSGSGASLTNLPSAQLSGALPALDGSALTGVTASGSGVIVKHDGTTVGTAGTINFSTNLDVTAVSAGIVTITASAGSGSTADVRTNSLVVSGVSTFSGITTFSNDITFDGTSYNILFDQSEGALEFDDNAKIKFGDGGGGGMDIVHSGGSSGNGNINNRLGGLVIRTIGSNAGDIFVDSKDDIQIRTHDTINSIICTGGAGVDLYHYPGSGTSSTKRIETTQTGAKVTGILTATSFSGSLDASNLTGEIASGRFPATLPAVSGVNLTALNASEITSGTLASARIEDEAVTFAKMQHVGTGVFIGRNDSGTGDIETLTAAEARTLLNVADGATAGITTANTNVTATWSVTASDTSGYEFTGPGQDGSEDDPDIYLVRGHKYRFINTTGSSHPFRFKVSAGGTQYTDGISGSENGTQDFSVQHDAPASLVYQCTQHPSMVGNIYIVGQHLANGANNRVLTATSAYGINAEANMTFDGDDLTISHSGLAVNIFESTDNHSRLRIRTGNSSLAQLEFADQADADAGEIRYDHANEKMTFHVGDNVERVGINSSGDIEVTGIATATGLDINGSGDISGNFGVGTDSPATNLHVKGTGTDVLKIESTDAGAQGVNLILQHSPGATNMADNDVISLLQFSGVDDSNNVTTYSSIRAVATDVSNNNESGDITFHTRDAGTFDERVRIHSGGLVEANSRFSATYSSTTSITPHFRARNQNGTDNIYGGIQLRADRGTGAAAIFNIACLNTSTNFESKLVFQSRNSDGNFSEKMRITEDGCLLVGVSTVAQNSGGPNNTSTGTAAEFSFGHVNVGVEIRSTNGANNQKYLGFKYGGGPTDNGGIRRDGTSNNVEFYEGSDRRIKTNIQDMDNTLSKICQMSLRKFDYKDGTGSGVGVIGQELINIFPEKVTKTDDGTGDTVPDGVEPWSVGNNYTYQILKAIQELKAENDSLKARIATLEGS